MMQSI